MIKVLLFIFMSSTGQGSSAPNLEVIEFQSLDQCISAAEQLKEAKKPDPYSRYSYKCLEVKNEQ